VYFYYARSIAMAFTTIAVQDVETSAGSVKWAEALGEEIVKRQQADGSWINDAVFVREDDPVVATALAAQALTACYVGGEAAGGCPIHGLVQNARFVFFFLPPCPVCRAASINQVSGLTAKSVYKENL
jgi:hypothetical protein